MTQYMINPSEHFRVLNQALLLKMQTKCCATYCDNCPYKMKATGTLQGSDNWNDEVKGLAAKISIENSPNPDFKKIPEAAEIVERLKRGVASRDDVKIYTINN